MAEYDALRVQYGPKGTVVRDDAGGTGYLTDRAGLLFSEAPTSALSGHQIDSAVRRYVILGFDGSVNEVVGRHVLRGRLRDKRGIMPDVTPAVILSEPFSPGTSVNWTEVVEGGWTSVAGKCLIIDERVAIYRQTDGRRVYSPRTKPTVSAKFREWLRAHPEWPPKHPPAGSAAPDVEVDSVAMGPYTRALEAQLHLAEWWTDLYRATLRKQRQLTVRLKDDLTMDGLENVLAARLSESMETCATIFVRDEIARTIAAGVDSIPDDSVLQGDELPARSGFVYLEEPFEMPCHNPARHVARLSDVPAESRHMIEGRERSGVAYHTDAVHRLRAIGWTILEGETQHGSIQVMVDSKVSEPEIYLADPGDERDAVLEQLTPDLDPELRRISRQRDHYVIVSYVDTVTSDKPLVRDIFTITDGQPLNSPLRSVASERSDYPDRSEDHYVWDQVGRVGKFLLGLTSFMRQKLAAETRRPPNGLVRRRLDAEGRSYRPIRIIHLREREHADRRNGEPTGRQLHHRFIVARHPRQQHYPSYGPAYRADGTRDPSTHRLKWIEAYPKGPKGAPFKPSKTVLAVVR